MKIKRMMLAAAMLAVWGAMAAPGTLTCENGEVLRGDIAYRVRDKVYVVTVTKRGGSPISHERKAADVTGVEVEKPATFDKLSELVARGQGAAAVSGLEKLVADYKLLGWDRTAGALLVEAQIAAGNAQKAYEAAQAIIADDKSAAYDSELAPAYWRVLQKLGKTTQLENCLNKAATAGSRLASAEALVMRGDMMVAADDTPKSLRSALTDAYLRVVLMYTDEPCKEARRRALNSAAGCFDKLGMAARAEDFRAKARTL